MAENRVICAVVPRPMRAGIAVVNLGQPVGVSAAVYPGGKDHLGYGAQFEDAIRNAAAGEKIDYMVIECPAGLKKSAGKQETIVRPLAYYLAGLMQYSPMMRDACSPAEGTRVLICRPMDWMFAVTGNSTPSEGQLVYCVTKLYEGSQVLQSVQVQPLITRALLLAAHGLQSINRALLKGKSSE